MPTSTHRKNRAFFLFAIGVFFCVVTPVARAQTISGTVFRDFNSNGVYESIPSSGTYTYGEPGVPGVRVTAYASNTAVTPPVTTTTDRNGSYTLVVGSSELFRVEFTNLIPGDADSFRGLGNGTSVQFARGATKGVNFGLNYAAHYCGFTNPYLVTPSYTNGDPTKPLSLTASQSPDNWVVGWQYQGSSSGRNKYLVTGNVGATWGLAYQRSTNTLFGAALLKRHAGFGTGGPGQIYRADLSNPTNPASLVPTPFVNLQTDLGIAVGADPRIIEPLPVDKSLPNHDTLAFDRVGKMSLGDIDISDDDRTLWVMNLYDNSLYELPIGVPTTKPATYVRHTLPDPGCTNGTFRAWGINYYRGKVYVGGVCTAEAPAGTAADLKAYVYALDPLTNTFSQVLTFPLNYPRGNATSNGAGSSASAAWRPWINQWTAIPNSFTSVGYNQVVYPQPILSDIEFDTEGEMVIGLMDRFSQQSGRQNYSPVLSSTLLFEGVSAGDILRAGRQNDGTYRLENNATAVHKATDNAPSMTEVSLGTNQTLPQGPGNGEYYWQDMYPIVNSPNSTTASTGYQEVMAGGLAIWPGSGQLIATAFAPSSVYPAVGIRYFDNRTGASPGQYQITPQDLALGRAASLGDIEVFCANAPIEIGNRVWRDTNRDGVQDPNEPPIAGATVSLYATNSPTPFSTTTTAADGSYYFNSTTTRGLVPNGNYQLKVTSLGSDTAASGLQLTDLSVSPGESGTLNSGISLANNDARLVNNLPTINVLIGNWGENNHTFDFGFAPVSCSISVAANPTACNGASNQYSLTGSISFTSTNGSPIVLKDNASATTITLSTTGTSPQSFTLTGLSADGAVHTLTATSSSTLCSVVSTTYAAPASCSAAACLLIASVRTGICTPVTNGSATQSLFSATVTVGLSNPVPGVLTVSHGPVSQTFAVGSVSTSVTAVFTNLPADGATHSVSASLSGCSSLTTAYQAPLPCLPIALNPALRLIKTVDKSKAKVGDVLTYSLILTNTGSITATTTVRDSLSPGSTYVANSAVVPGGTTFTAAKPVSQWQVPLISPGQSLTLTLRVVADSVGILYNTATIPGDTATACTTIPIRVCTGDTYVFQLSAPAGRSRYRWFRTFGGITTELTSQTTRILDVSQPGSYSLSVNDVAGKCPDFSCCPFIIEESPLPVFLAKALSASCLGSIPQANGKLVLSGFDPAATYQYSEGAVFNPAAALSGPPAIVPANGVIAGNLGNPAAAKTYTVRVYNSAGCYADMSVTLLPTVCPCPPQACVPFTITQTKRGPRTNTASR